MLFVSHRLGEVLTIAQRVTVMKDGRTVGAHDITDLDRASLVGHIIGREAGVIEPFDHLAEPHEDVALEARALSGGPLREVDVKVRAGEVLGIGGLVGSGRTSLLLTLFGHHRPASGTIVIGGRPVQLRSPADAIRQGLALLPEERRDQGLLAGRGVRENVVLAHLRDFRRWKRIPSPSRPAEVKRTVEEIDRLRIVDDRSGTTDRDALRRQPAEGVAVAVARRSGDAVLMLDEPTKGVDVGAKAEILRFVAGLAASGVAVVIVSSDLEEIAAIAHRVVVLREGQVVAELTRPFTEAEILQHCYEHSEESA